MFAVVLLTPKQLYCYEDTQNFLQMLRENWGQRERWLGNSSWRTQSRPTYSSIQSATCSSETCTGTDIRVLMERLSGGWWHGDGTIADRNISAPLTSYLFRLKPSCHAKTQTSLDNGPRFYWQNASSWGENFTFLRDVLEDGGPQIGRSPFLAYRHPWGV